MDLGVIVRYNDISNDCEESSMQWELNKWEGQCLLSLLRGFVYEISISESLTQPNTEQMLKNVY